MEYTLLELLGFGLYKAPTTDGSTVYAVDTPFTFFDDDPIVLFVEKRSNGFYFFDEGLTLFQAKSVGYDVEGKFKHLSKKCESHGLTLIKNSGQIEVFADLNNAHKAIARFFSFAISFDNDLRKFVNMGLSEESFKNEVSMYYRIWRPEDEFEMSPKIKTNKGVSCEFDFRFGNRFVDAIIPKSENTGRFMRKSAILQKAKPYSNAESFAVIDDSNDKDKASAEMDVIQITSPCILLSGLKTAANNARIRTAI